MAEFSRAKDDLRPRIDIAASARALKWAKELGTDAKTLETAVKAAGPVVEDVRRYLLAPGLR